MTDSSIGSGGVFVSESLLQSQQQPDEMPALRQCGWSQESGDQKL